ncbi:MAG: DUF1559 domain-containing protein [Planctomycetes bacterium]|nr:DUF1559 domain-containing protein [Planctomycetota bacterium]
MPKKKRRHASSFWSRYSVLVGIGGAAVVTGVIVAFILLVGGGQSEPAKTGAKAGVMSKTEAKARLATVWDLAQLGLAMHSYHDVNLRFPPAAGEESAKSPTLKGMSWRAQILPYIERDALFLDLLQGSYPLATGPAEPWNRRGLERVPLLPHSATVAGKNSLPWHTRYRVFVGNGAAFEKGKALSFRDFKNGASNTIFIVEAVDAVPWPKPEELDYDAAKPLPKLGGQFADGCYAVFGDAGVRFITKNTDEGALRAWITRIEPSYLSKVERGEQPPPSEKTIVALARVLGEDPDVLLALAGKVSHDLRQIILKRPKLFAQLIRELKDLPDHAMLRLVREVRDGNW